MSFILKIQVQYHTIIRVLKELLLKKDIWCFTILLDQPELNT